MHGYHADADGGRQVRYTLTMGDVSKRGADIGGEREEERAAEEGMEDGRQLEEGCVMVEMEDSYGDGWNGAVYTITNAQGGVITTGTVEDGESSATDQVCDLGWACYTMIVSEGLYPDEVSWKITEAGVVVAEGGAGETADWCVGGPTSVPTTSSPTITSRPTHDIMPQCKALSMLYAGMAGPSLLYILTRYHTSQGLTGLQRTTLM